MASSQRLVLAPLASEHDLVQPVGQIRSQGLIHGSGGYGGRNFAEVYWPVNGKILTKASTVVDLQ
jgi:hypothetical protein